jgi:hypothetical protein
MRTGRPIPPLTVTPPERETLERWARRAKTAQAVAQRARLILGCAAGTTNTVVAHELRLTQQTVGQWRTRFLSRRLNGRLDEPRPAPRGRSPMRRSSVCGHEPSRRPRRTPRTGARDRWRSPAA